VFELPSRYSLCAPKEVKVHDCAVLPRRAPGSYGVTLLVSALA
jgi:hypothetical protein